MDEQKSTGILPSLEALVDKRAIRQRKQREYYAEKGKEVRRKYYLANIEEKRRAGREYACKKREQFKSTSGPAQLLSTRLSTPPSATPTPPPRKEHYDRNRLKQI